MTCPWKIHYGASQELTSQCGKQEHLPGDQEHEGPGLPQFPYQRITWQAGDRREYTGDWPGPCPECTLHLGHHGRHAP